MGIEHEHDYENWPGEGIKCAGFLQAASGLAQQRNVQRRTPNIET